MEMVFGCPLHVILLQKFLTVEISDFFEFQSDFSPLLCVLDCYNYLGGFLNRSVMLEICRVWNRLSLQIRVKVRM